MPCSTNTCSGRGGAPYLLRYVQSYYTILVFTIQSGIVTEADEGVNSESVSILTRLPRAWRRRESDGGGSRWWVGVVREKVDEQDD